MPPYHASGVWWLRCWRRSLVALILVVATQAASAGILQSIEVDSGTPVRVRLQLSSAAVPWARALPANEQSPHRVYLDLVDTSLGHSVPREQPGSGPVLSRIRTGQFTPTTARIVLDLATAVPYEVETDGTIITITLGATPAENAGRPLRVEPAPAHTSTPPRELPLVVIDAGHGGHDPGAQGVDGALEKVIVLQVAHRLAAKLPARLPVDSLLTRSDDSFIPLGRRLPPRAESAILFLSLHANACDDPRPRGLEVYYGSGVLLETRGTASADLANRITTALRARFIRVRGTPRPGQFAVLSRNPAPSVLVEIGYLTHQREANQLRDPHYQELITDALVDGIAAYLQSVTANDA